MATYSVNADAKPPKSLMATFYFPAIVRINKRRAREQNFVQGGEEERGREALEMKGERAPPLLGLLGVKVLRGINLAKRDLISSDPYVVLSLPPQRVKTKVIKRNVNPEWNEKLTFFVQDTNPSLKLEVFDKDTFSHDDPMGKAEIDIEPLLEFGMPHRETLVNGDIISVVTPNAKNCLVGESKIYFDNGKVVQDMILRLRDVECGEVELRLELKISHKGR